MTTPDSRIALTFGASTSTAPSRPFRPGAPNVLLVLLDDLGFAQLGCFGSDIETPTFDAIAARGVRFTNFHTTALCSPTRACLLSGRNHHRVGMGFLPDLPTRFPGYSGRIPPEAGLLPEILREEGYATYLVGKWHLTPRDERTPAGPFTTWPLGKGFERFYGFLGGDANQWTPDLVNDNTYVDPPRRPEDGYHLNEDLADHAIDYLRTLRAHQPDRPWFCFYSTGATHAPHHVPREWADRYRGRFDDGWDAWRERTLERQQRMGIVPAGTELSPRPGWVAAWSACSADERRVYARMMEVFAGFLSHTDHHLGRVLNYLEQTGELDDTIVVVASDNGCSAEGGPHGSVNELRFIENLHEDFALNLAQIDELGGWRTYNHYPWGWALAGNTPLRRWKRYTWEGGVRDPLIVSWPGGLDPAVQGAVRDHYTHAIDVLPTVLDCLDVAAPSTLRGVGQMSLDGVSFRHLLDPDGAAAPPVRTTQYYEMWGSRAIYHDGWKAVTDHVNQQHPAERDLTTGSTAFDDDVWSLFRVADDFAEVHDLAAERPDVLDDLVARWHAEAGRNGVLPLSDGVVDRFAHMDFRWLRGRRRYDLPAGVAVHEEAGPALGADFAMTAELGGDGLRTGDEGLLCEQGDWTNGWAWYVRDGDLAFVLNYVGESLHVVRAPVPAGATALGLTFARTEAGGGRVRLLADGIELTDTEVAKPIPFRWTPNGAFLTVGHGRGFPVCDEYVPPFRFSGPLRRVVVVTGAADITDVVDLADAARDREMQLRHQ
jgi:arylsulfatase A-like enzyme